MCANAVTRCPCARNASITAAGAKVWKASQRGGPSRSRSTRFSGRESDSIRAAGIASCPQPCASGSMNKCVPTPAACSARAKAAVYTSPPPKLRWRLICTHVSNMRASGEAVPLEPQQQHDEGVGEPPRSAPAACAAPQRLDRARIEERRELAGARHRMLAQLAPGTVEVREEGYGEAVLRAVPHLARQLLARERAQQRLRFGLQVARGGLREREIAQCIAEQGHAHLQSVRHAGAVGLGEAVLAQVRPQVGAHQRIAVHPAAEGARELAPALERRLGPALRQRLGREVAREALARHRPGPKLDLAVEERILPGEAAAQERTRGEPRAQEHAQQALGGVVRIAVLGVEEARIAAEQLVTAVARERHLDVAARELGELVGWDEGRVGERLVERSERTLELGGTDARRVEYVVLGAVAARDRERRR